MTEVRARRWGGKAIAAVVIGVILALIAFFMLQSGNEHKRDYEAFQRCLRSEPNGPGTGVCTLEQKGSDASTVSDYKKNYERQLLLGKIGLALGGLLIVGGTTLVILDRRKPSTPTRV